VRCLEHDMERLLGYVAAEKSEGQHNDGMIQRAVSIEIFPATSYSNEIRVTQLPPLGITSIRTCMQHSTEGCILTSVFSMVINISQKAELPSSAYLLKAFHIYGRNDSSGSSRQCVGVTCTRRNLSQLVPFAASCPIHLVNQITRMRNPPLAAPKDDWPNVLTRVSAPQQI
jgi:hypothetical protein